TTTPQPVSGLPAAAGIDESLIEIYPPETEAAGDEGVTTIVFDEDEIVGGGGEQEKAEGEKADEKDSPQSDEGVAVVEEPKKDEAAEVKTADEAKGVGKEKTAEEAKENKEAEAKAVEAARKSEDETPPQEEVEEARAKAGRDEPVEADAEAAGPDAKDGGKRPPQAEGEGGETGQELSAWKAKVSGATKSIKQPEISKGAESAAGVRKVGSASSGRASASRKQVQTEAEKVISPPPSPPDPLPVPEDDPTGATQLVRDASDKKLPNQTLPQLVALPSKTMPKLSAQLSAAYSTKVTTEAEIAKAEKASAETAEKGEESSAKGKKDPQLEKNKKVKDAKQQKKPVGDKEAPAEPLVLVDEGAPIPAPMTKTTQVDVGKVLAVIASDPLAAAKEMVTDAREAAYPGGQLLEPQYDDFGAEVLPVVEVELRAQLTAIREQAGISKKELDEHIAERREKLATEGKAATVDLVTAKKEEAEEIREKSEENAKAIAGARETMDLNTERHLEAAGGDSDPTLVNLKRERLLRGVGRKVAQQVVAYTQAGERREKALADMESPLHSAYVQAARDDETKIYDDLLKATKPEKDPEKEKERQKVARDQAGLTANPGFVWVKTKLSEVTKQIGALKTEAKQAAGKLVGSVRAAGEGATTRIRDWAESRVGTLQSWWQSFLDMIRDWGKKADYEAEAWEQARNSAERDAVVRDLDALKMVETLEAQKIDGKAALGASDLTEEQRAVINSYYEGPAKGDKIAAVAAGMRARLATRQSPEL
ncbi:MAG TPA: hypothetical protein VGA87_08105, partial [Pyrinomonadaceae bacterium]